jgi:hypothetical protein
MSCKRTIFLIDRILDTGVGDAYRSVEPLWREGISSPRFLNVRCWSAAMKGSMAELGASLVQLCKLNSVEPLAYLTATLTSIVNGATSGWIGTAAPPKVRGSDWP